VEDGAAMMVASTMVPVLTGDSQINGQPSALKPGDDVFQIQLV
jgi:hypothetical protein